MNIFASFIIASILTATIFNSGNEFQEWVGNSNEVDKYAINRLYPFMPDIHG
jgi:hypothetical protein